MSCHFSFFVGSLSGDLGQKSRAKDIDELVDYSGKNTGLRLPPGVIRLRVSSDGLQPLGIFLYRCMLQPQVFICSRLFSFWHMVYRISKRREAMRSLWKIDICWKIDPHGIWRDRIRLRYDRYMIRYDMT